MKTVPAEQILENLSWRYATKKFDPAKKIPPALWGSLEKAAILAPSSYGLQPWRFVVVTDGAVRAKLRAVSWNQPQITDASHLVVFARNVGLKRGDVERYIARISEVRGVGKDSLKGFQDMMIGTVEKPGADNSAWAARQVYIALGFFLSACAMSGVDACPMEGFEPEKYDEILGLKKDGYAATVLAAAGYRASDDPIAAMKKVRFEEKDVVKRV